MCFLFVCEFIYSEEKLILSFSFVFLVLGSFCGSLTTENRKRIYVDCKQLVNRAQQQKDTPQFLLQKV